MSGCYGSAARGLRIAVVCGDRGIAATGRSGASEHLRSICGGFLGQGARVQLWCQRMSMGATVPPAALPMGLDALEGPRGRLPGALRKRASWDHGIDARAMSRWACGQGFRFQPHLIYERFSLFSNPGLGVARRLQVPYVLELNAPLSWEAALFRGLPASPGLLRRESRALTAADLLVCVSPELRDYALRRGVEEERVLVQRNGADPATDPISSSCQREEGTAAGERPFVLGYAGSFKPWQGLLGAIPRLRALRDERTPRRLHIDLWGDGPERMDFIAAAREQEGISLSWHGWGNSEELRSARCGWDAAWAPLAPWPPLTSSDGRTIAALEQSFGECVPGRYFSPMKEAEGREAGLPIWPPRAQSSVQASPMAWTQIAANILRASGFSAPAPRGKRYGGESARRQASP